LNRIRIPLEILDKAMCHVINMGLDEHTSGSQGGQKLTAIDAPLLSSLEGGRELAPGSYMSPGAPREKEGSRSLECGLGVSVSLQILSFCGMALYAGRALNARLIRYNVS